MEKVKADGCLLFAITVAKKETSLSSVFSAIEQQRKIDKTAEAKKKTSERIARRMKKIGKAAILPLPEGHDNTPLPLFFTAFEQNVLSFISPKELVNPQIFNPQNYPILFVFGDESYIQTVHEQGDGDRAIIQYLKGGGTIVALPNGPTPFAYNEKFA